MRGARALPSLTFAWRGVRLDLWVFGILETEGLAMADRVMPQGGTGISHLSRSLMRDHAKHRVALFVRVDDSALVTRLLDTQRITRATSAAGVLA